VKSRDVVRVDSTLNVDDFVLLAIGSPIPGTAKADIEPSYRCPRLELVAAMTLIGGKWKALIICELSRRSMRYSEIDSALNDVSHRILTYELQALVKGGVIARSKFNEGSNQYSLTARGQALYKIIQDLIGWARTYEAAFEA
jgi:DNA-binding HxlR family transcriptional regulator